MHIDQILQQKVLANTTTNQLLRRDIPQDQVQQDGVNLTDLAISLSPLSFILIWAIFLVILQKTRSHLDNKIVFTINGLQKVPCKNCKFFSNNHYLKCAVQPDIVLTEEAIHCSEYCPRKVKFSVNQFFN
ncbi:hypothetical protein [Anabaena sp. PCC 7108]|uniref:hypothetical protein n=1 Tax=Anabaena sp. PCC 7108 TaxID=163908 RepID=UPI000371E3E4|nr:hypothetical protein [Anabaena sp. PCC 7108]